MRHSEFWDRLRHHLGAGYAGVWADQFVIGALGQRTVNQALAAGMPPKQVWSAVWRALELPASER